MGNYIELDGKTLYIKIEDVNPEFIIHASGKIEEEKPTTVVVDVRGLPSKEGLAPLTESLKSHNNVICLLNAQTSPEVVALFNMGKIVKYEDIPFATEEDKNNFELLTAESVIKYSENQIDRLSTSSEKDLNERVKYHIQAIISDYESVLTEEQKAKLNGLQISSKDYVAAVNEVFHSLISPAPSDKHPDLNSYLTAGLVDMATIDYFTHRNLYDSFESKHPSEVIFAREKLMALPDEESKKKLITSGSIDQFVEATSKSEEEFMRDFQEAVSHQTKFDKAVESISNLDPKFKDGYQRIIMKMATHTSTEQALLNIQETFRELKPEDLGKTPEELAQMVNGINAVVASYNASKEASL